MGVNLNFSVLFGGCPLISNKVLKNLFFIDNSRVWYQIKGLSENFSNMTLKLIYLYLQGQGRGKCTKNLCPPPSRFDTFGSKNLEKSTKMRLTEYNSNKYLRSRNSLNFSNYNNNYQFYILPHNFGVVPLNFTKLCKQITMHTTNVSCKFHWNRSVFNKVMSISIFRYYNKNTIQNIAIHSLSDNFYWHLNIRKSYESHKNVPWWVQ